MVAVSSGWDGSCSLLVCSGQEGQRWPSLTWMAHGQQGQAGFSPWWCPPRMHPSGLLSTRSGGQARALALSHLSPGMASGLHPCLGFSRPGDTPRKALVLKGKCPSLPLLHPDLSSIGLASGAEPGGADVLAGAPGQGAVGACAPATPMPWLPMLHRGQRSAGRAQTSPCRRLPNQKPRQPREPVLHRGPARTTQR